MKSSQVLDTRTSKSPKVVSEEVKESQSRF